jgi:hypothetical protein
MPFRASKTEICVIAAMRPPGGDGVPAIASTSRSVRFQSVTTSADAVGGAINAASVTANAAGARHLASEILADRSAAIFGSPISASARRESHPTPPPSPHLGDDADRIFS